MHPGVLAFGYVKTMIPDLEAESKAESVEVAPVWVRVGVKRADCGSV